jgi:hypothetical protein
VVVVLVCELAAALVLAVVPAQTPFGTEVVAPSVDEFVAPVSTASVKVVTRTNCVPDNDTTTGVPSGPRPPLLIVVPCTIWMLSCDLPRKG